MSKESFIKTVAEMRQAQKDFFNTRKNADLQRARELEKKVDDMMKEYYRQAGCQNTLFNT